MNKLFIIILVLIKKRFVKQFVKALLLRAEGQFRHGTNYHLYEVHKY